MVAEKKTFHAAVNFYENTAGGCGSNFQKEGFIKNPKVALVQKGVYHDYLVSPRGAAEYDIPCNGAESNEMMTALEMSAGHLRADDILKELDTGVYINNTWYLNFSDLAACRLTGMTRFATFWVENGKIVAPLNVMRFDETAYRMLGENLIGITQERDFMMSDNTYVQRNADSMHLPGILVKDFQFTL